MHLIEDIVEYCVNLLSAREDSLKVRAHEKSSGRFRRSWILIDKQDLPQQRTMPVANERACQVFVPTGFVWRPKPIFVKSPQIKSHQWKQVACSNILTFCIHDMLGHRQQRIMFRLFNVIRRTCAECIDIDSLDSLENVVHKALAYVERDFPISVVHLLLHLPLWSCLLLLDVSL